MTALNITTDTQTVVVTENDGISTVVTVPETVVVTTSTPGPQGSPSPRSLTVGFPQPGDSFTLFRTTAETSITNVVALVNGVTPSVIYEIRYDTDRSALGTIAVPSTVVTNTTTGTTATLQNMPIPINSYVWINVLGIAGEPSELHLSVAF